MDIMKNFPDAETVRDLTPVGLQTFIFEQRLKLLRKRILAAAAMGENEIKVMYVYDEVKDYLEEKGYKVTKKYDNLYIISWAAQPENSSVNVNINLSADGKAAEVQSTMDELWENLYNSLSKPPKQD